MVQLRNDTEGRAYYYRAAGLASGALVVVHAAHQLRPCLGGAYPRVRGAQRPMLIGVSIETGVTIMLMSDSVLVVLFAFGSAHLARR